MFSVIFSVLGSLIFVCLAVLLGTFRVRIFYEFYTKNIMPFRYFFLLCEECAAHVFIPYTFSIRFVCDKYKKVRLCMCASKQSSSQFNDKSLNSRFVFACSFFVVNTFIFSFILQLILCFIFYLIGWYFVWKFFLSRFRLVRELLGQISDGSPSPNGSKGNDSKRAKGKKARRD